MKDKKASAAVCRYKTAFPTKAEAIKCAEFRTKRDGVPIGQYQCQTCGKWHLTGCIDGKIGGHMRKGKKKKKGYERRSRDSKKRENKWFAAS